MSHELRRMYAVMATEVDATPLDPPEIVRRRTDRRTRTVTMAACVLVAVAVVGSLLVGRAFLTSSGPPTVGDTPPPNPVPTVTQAPPGPTESPTSRTPPLPIPDSAFVSLPADWTRSDGSGLQDVDDRDWLPTLCDAAFPTAPATELRTRMAFYNEPPLIPDSTPTGTVHHLIMVSDEATVYMAGLRSLIGDGCTTEHAATPGQTTTKARVLAASTRGDDSLLIEMHWSSTIEDCCPPNPDFIYHISATRIGTVLSVIVVQGWEGFSADRAHAELFTDLALAAVREWSQ